MKQHAYLFPNRLQSQYIPTRLEALIEKDFEEYEKKKKEEADTESITVEKINEDGTVTTTTTTTTTKVETVTVSNTKSIKPDANTIPHPSSLIPPAKADLTSSRPASPSSGTATPAVTNPVDDANVPDQRLHSQTTPRMANSRMAPRGIDYGDAPPTPPAEEKGKIPVPQEDQNSVYIGLRVYTNKEVPAVVVGRLKADAVVKAEAGAAVSPAAVAPASAIEEKKLT